jgi:hypothetical protein
LIAILPFAIGLAPHARAIGVGTGVAEIGDVGAPGIGRLPPDVRGPFRDLQRLVRPPAGHAVQTIGIRLGVEDQAVVDEADLVVLDSEGGFGRAGAGLDQDRSLVARQDRGLGRHAAQGDGGGAIGADSDDQQVGAIRPDIEAQMCAVRSAIIARHRQHIADMAVAKIDQAAVLEGVERQQRHLDRRGRFGPDRDRPGIGEQIVAGPELDVSAQVDRLVVGDRVGVVGEHRVAELARRLLGDGGSGRHQDEGGENGGHRARQHEAARGRRQHAGPVNWTQHLLELRKRSRPRDGAEPMGRGGRDQDEVS